MTFVLVDYKGGSAFTECAHLPHVTGMVTDLDAHLTQRALASLSAELTPPRTGCWPPPGPRTSRTTPNAPGASPPPAAAPAGDRDRRVRVPGPGPARLRDRPGRHRPARPLARHPPDPGHPAALRRGVGRHPRQHQPADRAAGHRRGRERGRDRRARRRADLPDHPRPRRTRGSATPRWCHSRQAGSAAAGPARRRRRRPWLGAEPAGRAWAARNQPARRPRRPAGTQDDGQITDLAEVLVGRDPPRRRRPGHPGPAQPVAGAAAARAAAPRPARAEPAEGLAGQPGAGHAPIPFGLDGSSPPAAAAARGHRPGHLRAPDGGGRAAVRAVPAAAHPGRRGRGLLQLRRRPPVRHRLRQRRAAAARRACRTAARSSPAPRTSGPRGCWPGSPPS